GWIPGLRATGGRQDQLRRRQPRGAGGRAGGAAQGRAGRRAHQEPRGRAEREGLSVRGRTLASWGGGVAMFTFLNIAGAPVSEPEPRAARGTPSLRKRLRQGPCGDPGVVIPVLL